MFINDLQNCLENVDTKFGVRNVKSTNPALADDIACISVSLVGLQKMLEVAYTYSSLWCFTFNARKSGFFFC